MTAPALTVCPRCGASVPGVDPWRTCTACFAVGGGARVADRRGGQFTIVLANAHLSESAAAGSRATSERSHVCEGGACTSASRCDLAERHANARTATRLVALARRLDAVPHRTLREAAELCGARDALSLATDEVLALLPASDRAYVLALRAGASEAA